MMRSSLLRSVMPKISFPRSSSGRRSNFRPKARWNSRTNGNPGAYLALQTDGNLVVYSTTNKALWNAGTKGKIVGKGKHQDLLKNCQVYREIAYSQLSKEELADA